MTDVKTQAKAPMPKAPPPIFRSPIAKHTRKYGETITTQHNKSILPFEDSVSSWKFASRTVAGGMPATGHAYADSNAYEFPEIKIPDGHWMCVDRTMVEVTCQFNKTAKDTVIPDNETTNITSVFNLFGNAELDLEGTQVERFERIGQANRMMSYLQRTKANLLQSNGYHLHYDRPTLDVDEPRNIGIPAAQQRSLLVVTGGTLTPATNITGTVGADPYVVEFKGVVGNTTETVVLQRENNLNLYSRDINEPARERREKVIDAHGATNRYRFSIPISYFSKFFEAVGQKGAVLPIKSFVLRLERNPDNQYLIGVAPFITIYDLRIELASVKFTPPVDKFYRDIAKVSPIVIPYLRFDHYDQDCSAVTQLTPPTTGHRNLIMILEWFATSTAGSDPMNMRWAKTWEATIANLGKYTKKHTLDTNPIDASRQEVADQKVGDVSVAYLEYKQACFTMGIKDDLAITRDEFSKYRPLFVTYYGGGFEGLAQHDLKAKSRTLAREWEFSQATSANTRLHMFAISNAYVQIKTNADGSNEYTLTNTKTG